MTKVTAQARHKQSREVASQHTLVCGWGLQKWRSVPSTSQHGSGKTLHFTRFTDITFQNELIDCSDHVKGCPIDWWQNFKFSL